MAGCDGHPGVTVISVTGELLGKHAADFHAGLTEVGGIVMRLRDGKQTTIWLHEAGVRIGQDGQLPTQAIEMLKGLNLPLQLVPALQLANLAVSAAGFALVLRRLGQLDRKLDTVLGRLAEVGEDVRWVRDVLDAGLLARLNAATRKLSLPVFDDPAARRAIFHDLVDIGEALDARRDLLLTNQRALAQSELFEVYTDYLAQCIRLQLSTAWVLGSDESAILLGEEWAARLDLSAERLVGAVRSGTGDLAALATFATLSDDHRRAAGATAASLRATAGAVGQATARLRLCSEHRITPAMLAKIDADHPGQLVLLEVSRSDDAVPIGNASPAR